MSVTATCSPTPERMSRATSWSRRRDGGRSRTRRRLPAGSWASFADAGLAQGLERLDARWCAAPCRPPARTAHRTRRPRPSPPGRRNWPSEDMATAGASPTSIRGKRGLHRHHPEGAAPGPAARCTARLSQPSAVDFAARGAALAEVLRVEVRAGRRRAARPRGRCPAVPSLHSGRSGASAGCSAKTSSRRERASVLPGRAPARGWAVRRGRPGLPPAGRWTARRRRRAGRRGPASSPCARWTRRARGRGSPGTRTERGQRPGRAEEAGDERGSSLVLELRAPRSRPTSFGAVHRPPLSVGHDLAGAERGEHRGPRLFAERSVEDGAGGPVHHLVGRAVQRRERDLGAGDAARRRASARSRCGPPARPGSPRAAPPRASRWAAGRGTAAGPSGRRPGSAARHRRWFHRGRAPPRR